MDEKSFIRDSLANLQKSKSEEKAKHGQKKKKKRDSLPPPSFKTNSKLLGHVLDEEPIMEDEENNEELRIICVDKALRVLMARHSNDETAMDEAELAQELGISFADHPEILEALRNHPKISYLSGLYSYNAVFKMKDKDDLVQKFRDEHVILKTDLRGAFKGVNSSIADLEKDGAIAVLEGEDRNKLFFYYDEDLSPLYAKQEILTLWRQFRFTGEDDIMRKMEQYDIKPMERVSPLPLPTTEDSDDEAENARRSRRRKRS